MKESLHPLKNKELAWTEQIPVPAVACDLSLADSNLQIEFDTKKFSEYLRSNGIKDELISDMEVYFADIEPDILFFSQLQQ